MSAVQIHSIVQVPPAPAITPLAAPQAKRPRNRSQGRFWHGFGGGYFQPIVGSKSRPAGPLPDMTLEENMTVVVQPNVITPDQTAGVQVGEMIRLLFQSINQLPNSSGDRTGKQS